MFPNPKDLLGRLHSACQFESSENRIKLDSGLNLKLHAGDDLLKVDISNQTNVAMDYRLGNCVIIKQVFIPFRFFYLCCSTFPFCAYQAYTVASLWSWGIPLLE